MLRYFLKLPLVWDKDSCSGVFWTSKTEKYLLKVNSWNFLFTHRLVFFHSNFYFILFKNLKNHILKLKLFLLKIELFSFWNNEKSHINLLCFNWSWMSCVYNLMLCSFVFCSLWAVMKKPDKARSAQLWLKLFVLAWRYCFWLNYFHIASVQGSPHSKYYVWCCFCCFQ